MSPIFRRLYLGLVQIANYLLVFFMLAQIYLWSSPAMALACCFTLLWFAGASYFICKWAENAFYLPPNLLRSSDIAIRSVCIVLILCVVVFTGSSSILILSVVFVLQLCKCIIKILDLVHLDTDRVYWFAPTLFPVYSYCRMVSADETRLTVRCVLFCGIGVCWTAALACFSQCISIGTLFSFSSSRFLFQSLPPATSAPGNGVVAFILRDFCRCRPATLRAEEDICGIKI